VKINTLQGHLRECHPEQYEERIIVPLKVHVQQLGTSTQVPYFAVKAAPEPSAGEDPWEIFESQHARDAEAFKLQSITLRASAPTDRSSMERATGWAAHVSGHDPEELCRLVAPAGRSEVELLQLKNHIEHYFAVVLDHKANIGYMLQQELGSKCDPTSK
jgi:hypothetical protein